MVFQLVLSWQVQCRINFSYCTTMQQIKSLVFLFLKISAAITLAYYVAYEIDWANIPSILAKSDKLLLLFAIVFYLCKNCSDAFRWRVANRIYGIKLPLTRLIKYEIIGPAFDFISPIPQSEDLYKFYQIRKETQNTMFAVSIPILMRLVGLFTTVLFLIPMYLYYQSKLTTTVSKEIIISGGIIISLAVILVLSKSLWLYRLPKAQTFFEYILQKTKSSISLVFQNPIAVFQIFLINLFSHLCYVCFIWFVCLSIGIKIPLFVLTASLPLIYGLALLPIMIGGIGLKESGWLWVITEYGINEPFAQSAMIIHLLVFLSYVSIGILLFLFEKNSHKI